MMVDASEDQDQRAFLRDKGLNPQADDSSERASALRADRAS